MSKYSCTVKLGENQAEAFAEIGEDEILISGGLNASLLYANISDMRLLNYNLILTMTDGEVKISKLGYETENFFEKLWEAYAKKSIDALFVTEKPVIDTEGDYFFEETSIPDGIPHMSPADSVRNDSDNGVPHVAPADSVRNDSALLNKKGIARLSLYSDCVCLIPHNIFGRRIPLCFATEPERDGFAVSMSLDTGEKYGFSRLGFNTDPFFERLIKFRNETVKKWTEAHVRLAAELDCRIGKKSDTLNAFRETYADIVSGLFAADDENNFWIAAVNDGHAAVELITDEDTAVYTYGFDIPEETFIIHLRHAMEAVKKNRRLIYISDDLLNEDPLYRMSVARSPHVRFLRSCCTGRVIHTGDWREKVKDFLTS